MYIFLKWFSIAIRNDPHLSLMHSHSIVRLYYNFCQFLKKEELTLNDICHAHPDKQRITAICEIAGIQQLIKWNSINNTSSCELLRREQSILEYLVNRNSLSGVSMPISRGFNYFNYNYFQGQTLRNFLRSLTGTGTIQSPEKEMLLTFIRKISDVLNDIYSVPIENNQVDQLKKNASGFTKNQILLTYRKRMMYVPFSKNPILLLTGKIAKLKRWRIFQCLQKRQQLSQNWVNQYEQQYSNEMKKHHNNSLALCHGDLHLANILVNRENESIRIIDFEDAHIGIPIYDLAYLAALLIVHTARDRACAEEIGEIVVSVVYSFNKDLLSLYRIVLMHHLSIIIYRKTWLTEQPNSKNIATNIHHIINQLNKEF